MEQQPVQIVCFCPGLLEEFGEDRRHFAHREFVHLLAVHLNGKEATALMRAVAHERIALTDLWQLKHFTAAAI